MNIRIDNGHVVDPANGLDGIFTVALIDGRIELIAEEGKGASEVETLADSAMTASSMPLAGMFCPA